MKIIVDISADKIALYGNWVSIFLERNDVDIQLGKTLVTLDKKINITECLVLNWPGGFTNLRVGTLALNLLKSLKQDQLSFFSLSKIELYTLFYTKGWISRYLAVYIGQRLNVWLWDLKENTLIATVKKSEFPELAQKYEGLCGDRVFEKNYFPETCPQLFYAFDDKGCHFSFWWIDQEISWDELAIHPVEKLEPNYMIEPNVS